MCISVYVTCPWSEVSAVKVGVCCGPVTETIRQRWHVDVLDSWSGCWYWRRLLIVNRTVLTSALFAFCSTRCFGWRPRCRRLIRAVIARHQSRCYICAARNGTDIDLSNGRSSKWICCAAQLLSQHWTACHGRHDPSPFELPTRLRFVAYTAVGPELIKVKPLNADTERRRMTSGAAMWAFAPAPRAWTFYLSALCSRRCSPATWKITLVNMTFAHTIYI